MMPEKGKGRRKPHVLSHTDQVCVPALKAQFNPALDPLYRERKPKQTDRQTEANQITRQITSPF